MSSFAGANHLCIPNLWPKLETSEGTVVGRDDLALYWLLGPGPTECCFQREVPCTKDGGSFPFPS